MPTHDRKDAEKLLGVKLPTSSTEVTFYRERPSPDLGMYNVFISMRAPEEGFRSLISGAGLKWKGLDATVASYLPAPWHGPSDTNLTWWTPTTDSPELSAAKDFGTNGWIIAKYENGRIFIYATDSGSKTGTPGPW